MAGITFEVTTDLPIGAHTFHPKFRLFEVPCRRDDHVMIAHHFEGGESLETGNGQSLFSNAFLSVTRQDDRTWVYRESGRSHFHNGVCAAFDSSHTVCDVYFDGVDAAAYARANLLSLTGFTSDHFFLSRLLASRDGMTLHANGMVVAGRGVLFCGDSGQGKSTLTRMMRWRGHRTICDDRMLIRRDGERFMLHGSWCHGSRIEVDNCSAELAGIFFLSHGNSSRVERVRRHGRAVRMVLRAFGKSVFTADHWRSVLELVDDLCRKIPVYEVDFDLSLDVCEMIEEVS